MRLFLRPLSHVEILERVMEHLTYLHIFSAAAVVDLEAVVCHATAGACFRC